MEEIKNLRKLEVGDSVLFKAKKGSKYDADCFGLFLKYKNERYFFDITALEGGEAFTEKGSIHKGWLIHNKDRWTAYKLTEKEVKKYKLKIAVMNI